MNKYFTRENYAFLLGFIGVLIFALTLPITRHLTQSEFTSLEIGFGRGFLAGIASVLILLFKGQFKKENLPSRSAKLRYAVKNCEFYDFETDILEEFNYLLEIENYSKKL